MKIGIITFDNTLNYGAFLQMYSLLYILQMQNKNVEIIQYCCEAVNEREKIKTLKDITGVKETIKFLLDFHSKRKKYEKFSKEKMDNLQLSNRVYNKSNIHECENNYDCFVFGSDQIWNYNLTNYDYTYLGSFLDDKKKKIAYAASLGISELDEKQKKAYNHYLKSFNSISVRERQAVSLLSEIGINAKQVMDPIFLIKKERWNKIINSVYFNTPTEKYILLYQMTLSKDIYGFIKKLSSKTGYKVINANPFFKDRFKYKNISALSPFEWLKLINNAEYVITNSFHGLAFSICLNKQFYTEIIDLEQKTSSRLVNLLDIFELNNRNIAVNNSILSNIDYSRINNKIDDLRDQSINYIMENINE